MGINRLATTIAAAVLAAATLFALSAYADGQPAKLPIGYVMASSTWVEGSAGDNEALYEREIGLKPLTTDFATGYTGCQQSTAAYRIGIATLREAPYERETGPKPLTADFATDYTDCDHLNAAYQTAIDRHGKALARTASGHRHAHAGTAPLSAEPRGIRCAERISQRVSERRAGGSERRVHREGDNEPAGGYGSTS